MKVSFGTQAIYLEPETELENQLLKSWTGKTAWVMQASTRLSGNFSTSVTAQININMKAPQPNIAATFKDKLRGALQKVNHMPAWGLPGVFVQYFGSIIGEEAREQTDPDSPVLMEFIRNTSNPAEAIKAIDEFCKGKPG